MKTNYKAEKVTFRGYLGIFRGIKLPWLFFVLIFAATVAATLAALNIAAFTGDAVDAEGNVPTAQLVSFAAGYLLMALCYAGSTIFQGIASERINLGLREKLWRKIIYTKQSCYDQDNGETLVSRVTTDCDYASKLFTVLVSFLSMIVSFVMYIVQMYATSVTLANYMLVLIPLSAVIGWGYAKLKFLIAQKSQAMLSRSTTYLIERTRDLPFVKTSCTQEEELVRGGACFQEQYLMEIKTGLMSAFMTALQTAYNILSIAIPFAVGAGLVAAGTLTSGDVILFYAISGSVGTNFTNLMDYAGTLRQANGALARVINTMKLPDEQGETGKSMDEPDADLSLTEVTFGYGAESVLKSVTCEIPKHKVTAVIGANGSGKSTLFKLIDRLYEPESGVLRFGETDAAEYGLHAWRKTFAMVAQNSPLMEGTIRENICYGCERPVTEEELVHVAKLARVYDFVSRLPDGFDTKVVGGGTNFSGGQRQCIAIARAMMVSPDYLLLDEATSSLDAQNEHCVLEALDELMRGRTTLMIAHSLSAIRRADHVIVLRDGQAEASGAPREVLEESGNYLACVMNRAGTAPC